MRVFPSSETTCTPAPGTDSARHLRLAFDVDAARLEEAVIRLVRALKKQQ